MKQSFWHEGPIVLVLSETVLVVVIDNGATLTEAIFDHDRLDAYRLSIEYV